MKATAEERRMLTNPDSRGRDAMTISRPQDRQKTSIAGRPRFDPWLVVMAVGFALAIAAIAYPAFRASAFTCLLYTSPSPRDS